MTVTQELGDLFHSGEAAIGHGVNVYGVMGAGIAVGFKREYPEMFEYYAAACREKVLQPGRVLFWREQGKASVYNIASQDSPGANASYEWLEEGLDRALAHAKAQGFTRIGLPRIGAGIGGLEWDEVFPLFTRLSDKHGVDIAVWYKPVVRGIVGA